MTKYAIHIATVLVLSLGVHSNIFAQFINLQIRVEPELSATVEQDLSFGTLVSNYGRSEIQLGDVNMGVFNIRAFYTQNLYIDLEYPDVLINEDPENNDQIPIELFMAYNNRGNNNPANANVLSGNNGLISIHESTEADFDRKIWEEMYLYVYGSIDVGNIANGVYSGDIVL
ncbi:MAG: hypothetical protein RI564_08680, partial [Gracilimonas sp.]|nr:hypothetical protein [Gracilimonas sp.]